MLKTLLAMAALGLATPAGAQSSPPLGYGLATPAQAVDYSQASSWLCRPGKEAVCATGLDAMAIAADGQRTRQSFTPAATPPIDCFYVYPTASKETTLYADMAQSPELEKTVRDQVGRLSANCRIFAPIYRQLTSAGLGEVMKAGKPLDWSGPYKDVLAAWTHYLAHENHGRGVVLIGHSQGTILLQQLIAEQIDGKPVQKQLVSAFLAGDPSLPVPEGRKVGGIFKSIALCSSASQTGCAYVWGSYEAGDNPPKRLFGASPGHGLVGACESPAAPEGGSATLKAYLPRPADAPVDDPPYVALVDQLSGACQADAQGDVLRVTVLPARFAERLKASFNRGGIYPEWGLHRLDMALMQGNIADVIAAESATWRQH
jgi:hypothetical protein